MNKGPQRKQFAIALQGDNDVFIIKDYPKWNRDNVIVFEDCDKDRLKEKYLYWEHTINYKKYAID